MPPCGRPWRAVLGRPDQRLFPGRGCPVWQSWSVRVLVWAIGLGLEALGIAIALWGLRDLSHELFGRSVLPVSQAVDRVRRLLPWHRPRTVYGRATMDIGVTLSAHGQAIEPRPRDSAPMSEWNRYWDARLAAITKRVARVNADLKEARQDVGQQIAREASERAAGDAELESRFITALAGRNGRGLVKAWWGLLATFIGTLLAGLASPPT